jgi:ParB-like chromosome segregation protein Spo0J
MEIKQVNPNELIPYDKNSRVHSNYQINQIKKSIEHFGFVNPVLINGNNIVAGHGRTRAAKELGLTEIPAIDVSNLSEEQIRAYVIADNKIATNAEWDQEILRMELDALKELDFDVSILGFDPSEVEIKDIDYSVLDDEDDIDEKIDSLERETRRAIEVVFQEEHYQEAFELFKFWKQQDAYLGYMIMDFLRKEKEKLNEEV